MDRKEVACLAVVHNTAFSVVIKGFKPLDNGKAKSERNKCFFYKTIPICRTLSQSQGKVEVR